MLQTGRVIAVYERVYPEPIRVAAGEPLVITEREDLWEGRYLWVWCINAAGREGWLPDTYLDREQGVAMRDYSAWELSVNVGDTLTLLAETHGWYWAQTASGEVGWVPVANVELVPDSSI